MITSGSDSLASKLNSNTEITVIKTGTCSLGKIVVEWVQYLIKILLESKCKEKYIHDVSTWRPIWNINGIFFTFFICLLDYIICCYKNWDL